MSQSRKLIEVALPLAADQSLRRRGRSRFGMGIRRRLHLWWARRPLGGGSGGDLGVAGGRSHQATRRWRRRSRRPSVSGCSGSWSGWSSGRTPTTLRFWPRLGPRSIGVSPTGRRRSWIPSPEEGPYRWRPSGLGLTALAGDLNPVAVLINKAMIEIPPHVSPGCRRCILKLTRALTTWERAQGLAADVEAYGRWMRDEAQHRIGQICTPTSPDPKVQETHDRSPGSGPARSSRPIRVGQGMCRWWHRGRSPSGQARPKVWIESDY